MARPRSFRRIFREPQIKCFKPHSKTNSKTDSQINNDLELTKITLDEFEALRLSDYQNIKQKKLHK